MECFPSADNILIVQNDGELILYNDVPPQDNCVEIPSNVENTRCWRVLRKCDNINRVNSYQEFENLFKTNNIVYINNLTFKQQHEWIKKFYATFIFHEQNNPRMC